MTSRDYFKGKRVAVIGLGHHGEMVEDVKFLIKAGALVSVYDLKSEARLKNHLVFLRSIGLANYVCGSIPKDDLLDMDIIILSHEYPKDSTFLNEIKVAKKEILVEYPEILFFKQSPPVTLVGIIGTCGKSTLLSMVRLLLEVACASSDSQRLFVIDPESNEGILTHLKKIRSGDIVLIRITNLLMTEMRDIRISPHVAVFASLPMDEVSPFEVLSNQTYNNFIIASDDIVDMTHAFKAQPKAKMLRTKANMIPTNWGWNDKYPTYILDSMALALQTASLFKVDIDMAQDILLKWKFPKGRIELIKKIKGIEFYNDSASVLPVSTELAIKTLSHDKNIVLIMGGAKGEGYYGPLYEALPKYTHTVILLPGSGTILERRIIDEIKDLQVFSAPNIEEAVRMSLELAKKGDIVLFSPAFEAGGFDVSRKERGERFVRAVRGL